MSYDLSYPIHITKAEEGGFYITSPVLSIFTQGETEQEALENAKEAILCHIEGSAKDHSNEPKLRMVMLNVSVPDSLVS